jgi:murein DD-endopeptidase MepM/ murein hydrolase activator NlpD
MVKGPAGKITKMQPAPAKVEAVKTKPGKTAQIATPAAPKPAQPAPAKVAKIEAAPVTKVQQTPIKAGVDTQPTASLPPKTEVAAAPAADANPEFRWPARGRIIQGFKSGGNDGINISVPEGTAVKAAENGVVAYAGSELKGYGNLVLIRHPNGFVSAYANNGAIEVKRGDTVKRGQTIAKSGQTGNVATPQLHFELRKGSTPVDPTNYLAGL